MNIQWYPGHMEKARRQMQEDLKVVDLLIEVLDSRIPFASRNPEIKSMGQGKPRVILLNKADLADPEANARWIKAFEKEGALAAAICSRSKKDIALAKGLIEKASAEKRERNKRRGILNKPVRVMVCGIPNSGKSTFINTLCGKAISKTGNKPGVTRGKQWIRLDKGVELLDTPGILWPKLEEEDTDIHLALCGSIKDELLQAQELSLRLVSFLKERYPGALAGRYEADETADDAGILLQVARKRGCLKSGGEEDLDKAAKLLLDEFRGGKLGRISLERPRDGE